MHHHSKEFEHLCVCVYILYSLLIYDCDVLWNCICMCVFNVMNFEKFLSLNLQMYNPIVYMLP